MLTLPQRRALVDSNSSPEERSRAAADATCIWNADGVIEVRSHGRRIGLSAQEMSKREAQSALEYLSETFGWEVVGLDKILH